MDEKRITDYITNTFAGVETATTLDYTFFFYGPDRMLPFATIATAGNESDRVSNDWMMRDRRCPGVCIYRTWAACVSAAISNFFMLRNASVTRAIFS